MRMPRLYHRFYAWFHGWFWIQCVYCGRYFGGHEDVLRGTYTVDRTKFQNYFVPCPKCAKKQPPVDLIYRGE